MGSVYSYWVFWCRALPFTTVLAFRCQGPLSTQRVTQDSIAIAWKYTISIFLLVVTRFLVTCSIIRRRDPKYNFHFHQESHKTSVMDFDALLNHAKNLMNLTARSTKGLGGAMKQFRRQEVTRKKKEASDAAKAKLTADRKKAAEIVEQVKQAGGITGIALCNRQVEIHTFTPKDVTDAKVDFDLPFVIKDSPGTKNSFAENVVAEQAASVNFNCFVLGFPRDPIYTKVGKGISNMSELESSLKKPMRSAIADVFGKKVVLACENSHKMIKEPKGDDLVEACANGRGIKVAAALKSIYFTANKAQSPNVYFEPFHMATLRLQMQGKKAVRMVSIVNLLAFIKDQMPDFKVEEAADLKSFFQHQVVDDVLKSMAENSCPINHGEIGAESILYTPAGFLTAELPTENAFGMRISVVVPNDKARESFACAVELKAPDSRIPGFCVDAILKATQ